MANYKVYSSEYVSENNFTIIVKMFLVHTYYTIFYSITITHVAVI